MDDRGRCCLVHVGRHRRLPKRADLARIGDMAQATTLFDLNDRPVFTIFKEQRIEVPLAKVSPILMKAVIAVEDQRFYDHAASTSSASSAAALANVRSGRRSQGGSTITQQLARQSFLTPRQDRTAARSRRSCSRRSIERSTRRTRSSSSI